MVEKKVQFVLLVLFIALCRAGMACADSAAAEGISHVSTESTVGDVIHHPIFAGFGQFILPLELGYDENMPLSGVGRLLPYHSNVDPQSAVDTINHMMDELHAGRDLYYPLHEDGTGLFFFRGEPGAPFAVVCAGGGFSYVGSIHEGFPLAMRLAELVLCDS